MAAKKPVFFCQKNISDVSITKNTVVMVYDKNGTPLWKRCNPQLSTLLMLLSTNKRVESFYERKREKKCRICQEKKQIVLHLQHKNKDNNFTICEKKNCFCVDCKIRLMNSDTAMLCPFCRTPITN